MVRGLIAPPNATEKDWEQLLEHLMGLDPSMFHSFLCVAISVPEHVQKARPWFAAKRCGMTSFFNVLFGSWFGSATGPRAQQLAARMLKNSTAMTTLLDRFDNKSLRVFLSGLSNGTRMNSLLPQAKQLNLKRLVAELQTLPVSTELAAMYVRDSTIDGSCAQ